MDKNFIINTIQELVNKTHKNEFRKKIVIYNDRINFCCPVCGDSSTNHRAKRGNLYFDKLFFICFNEGCRGSLLTLCKKLEHNIDADKRLEMIEHLSNELSYKDYVESDLSDAKLDDLIDLDDIVRIFSSNEYNLTDFRPIKLNSVVYNYLINRGISSDKHKYIYEAKHWVNNRYENVVCFLNMNNQKVLGLQIRNLKEGKSRWFKIFNYETLYKWVKNVETIEDFDDDKIILYNKLSHYFNILNVDFSRTITIFEGFLDSLFYPNSIGCCGTNTDFRFLENNDLDLQYFFDNDFAGHKKSEEKIRNGYKSFLWKKMLEDIVVKKRSLDPYNLFNRINKIKDLNKLSCLVQDPYKKLELPNYFSKDIYDLIFIPKIKSNYKKIKVF